MRGQECAGHVLHIAACDAISAFHDKLHVTSATRQAVIASGVLRGILGRNGLYGT